VRKRRAALRFAQNPAVDVHKILVATDRSITAGRAVDFAADMANRYGAELLVLQVDRPEGAPAPARPEESDGRPTPNRIVVHPDPARAIVEVAEEEHVDVVVVGNVGMADRRRRLLGGSVPDRVSHRAPCTVVIVNTAGTED
jgi:nucleotide-binding universal stress UspA family protein